MSRLRVLVAAALSFRQSVASDRRKRPRSWARVAGSGLSIWDLILFASSGSKVETLLQNSSIVRCFTFCLTSTFRRGWGLHAQRRIFVRPVMVAKGIFAPRILGLV